MDSANELLHRLRQRSPAGFAIGLHIEYSTPKYMFQAYDRAWLDYYSTHGLIMQDPTVHWGFSNTGAIRWRDLSEDPANVLVQAAAHGIRYGLTVAIVAEGSRTIASFARADREMSDLDIAAISADLKALHRLTLTAQAFTPELHRTLRQLSIYLTHS